MNQGDASAASDQPAVDVIRRGIWRTLGAGFRRPSVLIAAVLAFLPVLALGAVLPESLVEPVSWLWTTLVVLPVCVWRMRTIDARELAAGRLTLPEPRRLDPSAREPADLAAATEAYRRYRRNTTWAAAVNVVGSLLPLGLGAALIYFDHAESGSIGWVSWLLALAMVGASGLILWIGLRVVPRMLRAAAALMSRIETGTARRRDATVVGFDQKEAVVERVGKAGRLVLRNDARVMTQLVAGDEISVLGDWMDGGMVVVTLPTKKGPATKWVRTRRVDQVPFP